jgi:hypothetical protein
MILLVNKYIIVAAIVIIATPICNKKRNIRRISVFAIAWDILF